MTQKMTITRVAGGIIAAGVVPLALGLAGPAYAFTPQEDAVIAQMEAAGYHHTEVANIIDNAHTICAEIGSGKSKKDVAFGLGMATNIGPDEAFKFVDVSVANLCPQ